MNTLRLKHMQKDHLCSKDAPHWLLNYAFRPLRRLGLVPDKLYLRNLYRCSMGESLNLKNPVTYNQKLQWLKLYNRKPEYTTMVDKYAVKKYVAEMIGEKYVIPLLGVWNSVEEIEWDLLPQQFVLKTTHGGGGAVIICKNKDVFDKAYCISKLDKLMNVDIYRESVEWPYKNVPHRIIAEALLEDVNAKQLQDYKFFCFDGIPMIMYISQDIKGAFQPHTDFFDMEFNPIKMRMRDPNSDSDRLPCKPKCFDEMKQLASKLSKGIPHSRIDFYEVNGSVFFGEITLYPCSGFVHIYPYEQDCKMGELINLPIEK